MSFYGNIKRVNSSPFVFDKYYPNRATMEAEMSSDGVYIGRYVLVKYTCKYTSNTNPPTLQYFNKYNITADGVNFTQDYQDNINADIDAGYKDTFDSTVWQKIYSQGQEKYIMVAELRAEVPKISLDIKHPQYLDATGEGVWNQPEISAQSDDVFLLSMPGVLELDVGSLDSDFYAADLTDPAKRYQMRDNGTSTKDENSTGNIISHDNMFSFDYNKVSWSNYYNQGNKQIKSENINDPIDGKKLDIKLYSFGQAISDVYDVLYGAPSGGTGDRPFYTQEALAKVANKYSNGLVGILSSIATEAKGDPSKDLYGRTYQPGQYYYFCSKWTSADEDSSNFIENIPEVVGATTENGGSKLKSHYFINFEATNGEYLTKWS